MNECYWNNWESLDGSGRGRIKPSASNDAYAASQEAGFNSLTTQHGYSCIALFQFFPFAFVFVKAGVKKN
jgi:hypothetical protein